LAFKPVVGESQMRFPAKASAAGLSLSLMAGTAWGAEVCARAPEVVALQVAALQQQLMVAALTCDDVSLYNSFVISYQEDLVASDGRLQDFFNRFGEEDGGAAYHAFKTKMANIFSARSAANKRQFCDSTRAAFAPALKAEKLNLASFALSHPSAVSEPYTNCGATVVAGGAMVTPTPAPSAPPSNILTAQNAASEAKAAGVASAQADEAGGRPLAAGLAAQSAAKAAEQAYTPPAAASPAPVAGAGANNAPPARNSVTGPNPYQDRGATTPQNRYAYPPQVSASQAYRERLAQQRAAQLRAAQERARVRYRDPYEPRGYYWPADPYWEYCYTRYGGRMRCHEAAQRFNSNQLYYRSP